MPLICRLNDMEKTNCTIPFRDVLQTQVRIGGQPISKCCDNNFEHFKVVDGAPCRPHKAPITIGSSTVRVNGMGVGRTNDDVGWTACTHVYIPFQATVRAGG